MKFIASVIHRFVIKDTKPQLGRWNIDYCIQKINKKVDLSNEDHCGPCGQTPPVIYSTNKNGLNHFSKQGSK